MRLNDGINLDEYEKRFGVDLIEKYNEDLKGLEELDLIEIAENSLKLTSRGALFSNEVFAIFV